MFSHSRFHQHFPRIFAQDTAVDVASVKRKHEWRVPSQRFRAPRRANKVHAAGSRARHGTGGHGRPTKPRSGSGCNSKQASKRTTCGWALDPSTSRRRPHDTRPGRRRVRLALAPPSHHHLHRHLPLVPFLHPASLSPRTLSETDAPPSSRPLPPLHSSSLHLTPLSLPQPPSSSIFLAEAANDQSLPRKSDPPHLLPLRSHYSHQKSSGRCAVARLLTSMRAAPRR